MGRVSFAERGEGAAPSSLAELQHRIAGCLDLDDLLSELGASLAALLPVDDRVSVVFLEPGGEWMRIYRVLPRAEERPGNLPRVRVAGTPVGQVVREGVPRVIDDVRKDPEITFGHASHDRIRSTLSVPIWINGRVMGAMNAGSYSTGACREEMLGSLAEIAGAVGPAIYAAEKVYLLSGKRRRAATAEPPPEGGRSSGLVGKSDAFRELCAIAQRAARSDADVLITGETGVGKTALARAIHGWSPRSAGPFVTVHLADLSPTIVESELFGHERGAFTGAAGRRRGRFESARGGTIFLDEVGETPPAIQAKLLRVIQDRCFERVGGGRTIEADVRVIAATSRDLREATARGEFREDLFFRLNVVPLHVPPLRQRSEDLELLVEAILDRIGGGRGWRLAPGAWSRLRAHSWPGNVRELESVLRRATILEEGDELRLDGFSATGRDIATVTEDWPTLEEHQRRYITRVLEVLGGVIEGAGGAARLLGLHPSTLRSRMKRLGISAEPMRGKERLSATAGGELRPVRERR